MLTIHVLPRRLKEFLLTHPLYKSPVGPRELLLGLVAQVRASLRRQQTLFSLPCLGKTSGCRRNAYYASELSAPHSQDSRLPSA